MGGGHSHVQVLRRWAMRPAPGVRLTLISDGPEAPYSGMLPGRVAGHYDDHDLHLDLGQLARAAGARFLMDRVTGLDLDSRTVVTDSHPPVPFDVLALNCGALPEPLGTDVIAVKPIGDFLSKWQSLRNRIVPGARIALVGGGAGGVELSLAMRRALPASVQLCLYSEQLLPGWPERGQNLARAALSEAGVQLVLGARVLAAERRRLRLSDGSEQEADHIISVTGVLAAPWLAESGLACDSRGFVKVDRCLRSVSHPDVFASGDVASLVDQPRPKSGVYAVRAGPVLARNLTRLLRGERLRPFRAQRRALYLLGTGGRDAIGVRGRFAWRSPWLWRWKQWLDHRFMARFQVPPMPLPEQPALPANLAPLAPDAMRCGGCGAKFAADPLAGVLRSLPPQVHPALTTGIGDDAAVLQLDSAALILTVDGFRTPLADPYRFGRIATQHALNDVYAMGATPLAALAYATVPLMGERLMQAELIQLLHGVVDVLGEQGAVLAGGHSAEGAELALALTVTGRAQAGIWHKGALRPGDVLVLTKALGTGVVLAAHQQGRLPSRELQPVLASMEQSHAGIGVLATGIDVSAATDVTGFGLLGHLGEMLRASGCGVLLHAAAVPVFSAAQAAAARGVRSSLQQANARVLADYESQGVEPARLALLTDPQTSGPLLLGVAAADAERLVQRLQAAGFAAAALGEVTDGAWRIT